MISTLTGRVSEKLADLVVIEVQGVGYGVFATFEDQAKLKVGDQAKVYVYEHIRENSHDLFGFVAEDTKFLFEQLINVNGVGPKMALNVLSVGTTAEVRNAIAGGDVKFIQAANGVGKKVAERVVVDLKDKVGLTSSANGIFTGQAMASADEAVQALVALGYTTIDAINALQTVDSELPTDQRIKQALKVGK
ncbi:MAG: Holliday junction branch migration protein RuvA [Candidatus Saccharimonadales bacterium]